MSTPRWSARSLREAITLSAITLCAGARARVCVCGWTMEMGLVCSIGCDPWTSELHDRDPYPSNPLVGSSRKSREGQSSSSVAIARRRFSPPEMPLPLYSGGVPPDIGRRCVCMCW